MIHKSIKGLLGWILAGFIAGIVPAIINYFIPHPFNRDPLYLSFLFVSIFLFFGMLSEFLLRKNISEFFKIDIYKVSILLFVVFIDYMSYKFLPIIGGLVRISSFLSKITTIKFYDFYHSGGVSNESLIPRFDFLYFLIIIYVLSCFVVALFLRIKNYRSTVYLELWIKLGEAKGHSEKELKKALLKKGYKKKLINFAVRALNFKPFSKLDKLIILVLILFLIYPALLDAAFWAEKNIHQYYYINALLENEVTSCKEIPSLIITSPTFVDLIRRSCILNIAITENNPDICTHLNDFSGYYNHTCYMRLAIFRGDPKMCDFLPGSSSFAHFKGDCLISLRELNETMFVDKGLCGVKDAPEVLCGENFKSRNNPPKGVYIQQNLITHPWD